MRFALFVLLFAWNSHGQQSERMAVASNAHACELFQYFRQMTDGNFCFSPFSSHQIAALLTAAANGETQKEIAAFAHLSGDAPQEIENAGALRAALAETVRQGALALEITNSLWAAESVGFSPSFLESARTHFGAALQKLPAGDATACAAAVNLWVREKTRGRIPQIVGPLAFAEPSRSVVVVNTVYLKGRWSNPFDLKLTKPRAFSNPAPGGRHAAHDDDAAGSLPLRGR
jgi:serine protease inhibitor